MLTTLRFGCTLEPLPPQKPDNTKPDGNAEPSAPDTILATADTAVLNQTEAKPVEITVRFPATLMRRIHELAGRLKWDPARVMAMGIGTLSVRRVAESASGRQAHLYLYKRLEGMERLKFLLQEKQWPDSGVYGRYVLKALIPAQAPAYPQEPVTAVTFVPDPEMARELRMLEKHFGRTAEQLMQDAVTVCYEKKRFLQENPGYTTGFFVFDDAAKMPPPSDRPISFALTSSNAVYVLSD